MNILVISDLHICNGDHFGAFQWEPREFMRVLDTIRERYSIQKVILNGDIYELYKYRFQEIEKYNRELMEYFKGDDFVYIKGNHDYISGSGRNSFLMENSQGKKIYIEHGHRADFFNGTRIGQFISVVLVKFLKLMVIARTIKQMYFSILERTEEIHEVRKYNSYRYLKYALKLLKRYDVVVLGHTHKIEAHKTYHLNSKKRYLNCGTCSLGRFQGIVLDTESLRYETIKLDRQDFENIDAVVYRLPSTA